MKQLDQASSKQRQKDFYLMKQIMWDDDFMTSENMRTVKQHYKSPKGQKHADKLKRYSIIIVYVGTNRSSRTSL